MSVRKEVFYGNAKALLGKPAKRVWFRLNPLLEKTSLFVSRQQDNSQFTLPLQSVVICEKFLSDESAFQSTCTEADFWDYLYSENWQGMSSVRVFEGQLFDSLLEALYAMEESKTVTSYQTGVLTENIRFAKKPFKESPNLTKIKETLNIRFTYFGRRVAGNRVVSSACSSETMSVPGFEDTALSDEEYPSYELEHDQHPVEDPSEEIPSEETRPETLALRKRKGNRKQDAAIEEYFSGMSSALSEPVNRSSPFTSYRDWIRSRGSSKPLSARSSPADKSPHQHTMYSLPHFRCSRPTRLHNEEVNLLEKRDQHSQQEEVKPESNGLWLTDIMQSLSLSGERTVDRLRKRLEELKAERKRNQRNPKIKAGNRFLEIVKLVDNYGKKTMPIPRLLRCEKVPTFRQYIVQIIEDKSYDPRFRNKRRVQKYSKRFNLQSLSDIDIESPEVKESPKKPTKTKKHKGNYRKMKPRKEPFKAAVDNSEQSTLAKSADVNPVQMQEIESSNFVEIVVGITDCTAFRGNLIGINEDEEQGLKGPADTQVYSVNPRDNSEGSRHKIKTVQQSSTNFSISTVVTNDTDSVEGGLAGSYRSQSNRSTADAMVIARGDSILSKYSKSSNRNRKTKLSNRIEEEDDLDFEEGNFSPLSGSTATPDLFDSNKLNRKYSFEKLKEAKTLAKPKFKDILKRFVKIQKVAAFFRKGAMIKAKRRTFVNPLQMSPSPDQSMQFVGKITYRREAIKPDMIIPDFKHLRVTEFREKLLKAMDEFVVRKEQIMSSYKNRSLTSITFTRPEVFSLYED